jgi:hypothetical protein
MKIPALKPVCVQKVILVFTPLNRDLCILESINAWENITLEGDIVMSVLFFLGKSGL